MKTFFSLFVIILVLSSCKFCTKPETTIPPALIIGDPLECGIENILLFPIGSSYTARVYEQRDISELNSNKILYFSENKAVLNDRFATVEYINENEKDFDIRNILFYNLLTGESSQLISDTIHILSFAIHKEFKKPLIFYRIVKQDFNNDKKFNSLDPVILYISNLNGDSLIRITPANQHFIDYNYYTKNNILLIKTIIDSDNNKEFSNSDETNFLEMNVLKPASGREIFSKSLKDSLKQQIILK